MLKDAPVAAVLPVTDLERAREFYTGTLGLPEQGKVADGVMFNAGAGTMFFIYQRSEPTKAEHTEMGFAVKDLEAEMEALRGKGVVFEEYDFPGLKTVNGIADMGGARSAWFKDPDGNIIALNEM